MTNTRESGFYWVRLLPANGLPVVAHWHAAAGVWEFTGSNIYIEDQHVAVLSERLVYTGEPVTGAGW